MPLSNEDRQLAIEAVATLAHLKRDMVGHILRPAGVPERIYRPLIRQIDPITSRELSKREIASTVLQELDRDPSLADAPRRIIEIAANWSQFELARDERIARGTVEMAKKRLQIIKASDLVEAERRELQRKADSARVERELSGSVL